MQTLQVKVKDDFWGSYSELVRQTVIPYQWEALNDRIKGAAPSYAIRNFRIAAGLEQGEFGGMVFQDSDLYKWLEAVAYSLGGHPDPELERTADEAIELIGQAQHEDGYINTYFSIKEPGKQWTNLHEAHELYCAGHMIEAAVAYYEATGKRRLLDIACRFADLIDRVFGVKPGQIRGYCGHQEIELALVRLYEATEETRYLQLSRYFIDERGSSPAYFTEEWERRGKTSIWTQGTTHEPDLAYLQSHLPVREQSVAVGHSVRAVYMYSAMADLARLTGDDSLREACVALWGNTTRKQMYITGGIGSTHLGEAFTFDYDLPNDTIYAETCASIGLIFWARRMLRLEMNGDYADVMERALYNNVLGSMSADGKHFFYVNPLEVWPEASDSNPDRRHVKAVRQQWFGCSCCPPNVARLLGSLHEYIYGVCAERRSVAIHLFIGSELQFELGDCSVKLSQQSALPWEGRVSLSLSITGGGRSAFQLALRVPGWLGGRSAVLNINGTNQPFTVHNGYARIDREWSDGDTLEWLLPIEAELLAAHPQIRANAGKTAIQRGPLVYCLEEADNGKPLASLSLAGKSDLSERLAPELLGGCIVVEGEALAVDEAEWEGDLPYRTFRSLSRDAKPTRFTAVPYYLWGNREPGEMSVWLRAYNGALRATPYE